MWPCRPCSVEIADRPARASAAEVTYSQVGSRGLPWTSVKAASDRRSGRAASQARVVSEMAVAGPLHRRPGLGVEPVDLDRRRWPPRRGCRGRRSRRARRAARRRHPARGRSRRRRRGARRRRPTRSGRARPRGRRGCCGCPTGRRSASRPNLAVRRSPRPSLARRRIARVRGRDAAASRGDRPARGRRARARRPRWTSSVPPPSAAIARSAAASSGAEVAALPGDEAAARCEQRERELDEVGQGRDGAGGDGRPAPAMAGIGGEGLGPDRRGLDRVRPGRSRRPRRSRNRGLLGDRLEEQRPRARQRRRERDARVAAARPEVDGPVDPALAEDADGGQAVDDVADRDRGRVADGRQVDRARSRPAAAGRGRRSRRGPPGSAPAPRAASPASRASAYAAGRVGVSSDARRERLTRSVQARLLCLRAIRPRGAAPGVGIVSHHGPALRSSAARPVLGRVSPGPSRTALPLACPSADAGR